MVICYPAVKVYQQDELSPSNKAHVLWRSIALAPSSDPFAELLALGSIFLCFPRSMHQPAATGYPGAQPLSRASISGGIPAFNFQLSAFNDSFP